MRILPPSALADGEFSVGFINALLQHWHTTRSFQCIGAPKKQHLLLLLDGCRVTYRDAAGRISVAEAGDVVYTPAGSEYCATLSDFCDAHAHTVGINFSLTDTAGMPLALSDGILIFRGGAAKTSPFFHRAAATLPTPLTGRILLLEALGALTADGRTESAPAAIRPALLRLAEDGGLLTSVAEMAALCHLSEPYFRKLFRHSMGVGPAAYRKRLRLERALAYLEFGEVSVGEISEMLGYASVSHFIKEFGQGFGISPLRYRKSTGRRDGAADGT